MSSKSMSGMFTNHPFMGILELLDQLQGQLARPSPRAGRRCVSPGTPPNARLVWSLAVLALPILGACREKADAPLEPAVGLKAPAYRAGAAQARAEFGRATVDFVNDEPRTCKTRRSGELLRFAPSVGPEEIDTGRTQDHVRLATGAIGRRRGQEGYEAGIERQEIEIGGAGLLAQGAGGRIRFAPDLQSGVALVGSGEDRVTITFRC